MGHDKELIVDSHGDSDDEQYNEAEDEDFNPTQIEADDDVSSSEDEASKPSKQVKKRKADLPEELDSGDEATIKERKAKRRRKHGGDEESDNEGGLIKTRSQHQAATIQRRQERRRIRGDVTVNVDQLWAELNALPVGHQTSRFSHRTKNDGDGDDESNTKSPEYIKIIRRIKFAGQVTEVEEQVPRDSDAARRYLEDQKETEEAEKSKEGGSESINRPLRRISLFEPNPLGIVKGVAPEKLRRKTPSRIDLAMAERRAEDEKRRKAEKLTTMQKTALDWKGFVIEQGLGDELDEYGKSKTGFLAREQFLDKVHGAKEVARRTARLKI